MINLIGFLKKIQLLINDPSNSLLDSDVEKQKNFLYSFREPEDNIERSYFQFLCQIHLRNKILNYVINIVSMPLFYYLCNKYSAYKKIECYKNVDVVFIPDGKEITVIPKSVLKLSNHLTEIQKDIFCLSKEDIKFIYKIKKRHRYSYEFLLKNLIKIAKYRGIITTYPNVKFIIVCAEYSYTSTILTEWSHLNSLQHINVMHGEKLFDIRDSFFNFDKCYVWDVYYKDLFIKLRAYDKQFEVEVPAALNFTGNKKVKKIYGYTYYLQGFETKKELKIILDCLIFLTKDGKKASIRPHPRYSNLQMIREVFDGKVNIEEVKVVSIEESVLRTENVISLYSTVLNQAFYNDVNVIIDDVANSTRFKQLKSLEYKFVVFDKFQRLSEVVDKRQYI